MAATTLLLSVVVWWWCCLDRDKLLLDCCISWEACSWLDVGKDFFKICPPDDYNGRTTYCWFDEKLPVWFEDLCLNEIELVMEFGLTQLVSEDDWNCFTVVRKLCLLFRGVTLTVNCYRFYQKLNSKLLSIKYRRYHRPVLLLFVRRLVLDPWVKALEADHWRSLRGMEDHWTLDFSF